MTTTKPIRIVNIFTLSALASAIILTIVATAVYVASVEIEEGITMRMTLWEATAVVGDQTITRNMSDMCDDIASRTRAASAMAIIAIISGAFGFVALLAHALNAPEVFVSKVPLMIAMIPTLFISPFCCVIAWALEANLWSASFGGDCGDDALKDADSASMGPSLPLFVIATVVFPVATAAYWYFNKDVSTDAAANLDNYASLGKGDSLVQRA